MQPKTRLVAVDIDGTLLDPAGKVRPAVRSALDRAASQGVMVVLATGRRFRTSKQIALDAGLTSYVICQHGTHVRRIEDDELVWCAPLETAVARGVVEVMSEAGFEPRVFLDGFEKELDFLIVTTLEKPREMFGYTGTAWRVVHEVSVPADTRIMEVASFGPREALEPAHEEIKRRFGESVGVHIINPPGDWYWCLEAISKEAGKGNALLALAKRLNVRPEETAAVGDDVNDVDMLRKAGVGIAMGNAPEAVKAEADFVVAPNSEDGLAEALGRLLGGGAQLEGAAPKR